MYLVTMLWPWMIGALAIGLLIGWLTAAPASDNSGIWPIVALVAIAAGVVAAVLRWLPDQSGLWLETALVVTIPYCVGCLIGGWARSAYHHEAARPMAPTETAHLADPAAAPTDDEPVGIAAEVANDDATPLAGMDYLVDCAPDVVDAGGAPANGMPNFATTLGIDSGFDAIGGEPATAHDGVLVLDAPAGGHLANPDHGELGHSEPEYAEPDVHQQSLVDLQSVAQTAEWDIAGTSTGLALAEPEPAEPEPAEPELAELEQAGTAAFSGAATAAENAGDDATAFVEDHWSGLFVEPPAIAPISPDFADFELAEPVGRSAALAAALGVTAAPLERPAARTKIVRDIDPETDDPPPAMPVPPRGGDNLTMIKGIGPKIAGRLHALGIWRFPQIGSWSETNANWIGSYLGLAGRVQREHWIAQACLLAGGGETDHARAVRSGRLPVGVDLDAPLTEAEAESLAAALPDLADPHAVGEAHPGFPPSGLDERPNGARNELSLIEGIGWRTLGRLQGLGIWTVEQIADWTPENVLWVDSYLALEGRIDREGWVSQARVLEQVKAGGTSLSEV